jgi:hypothetical protein
MSARPRSSKPKSCPISRHSAGAEYVPATDAEIAAVFKQSGTKGKLPDESMVGPLVTYMHSAALYKSRSRGPEEARSRLNAPFLKALRATDRRGAAVLRSHVEERDRFLRLGRNTQYFEDRIDLLGKLLSLGRSLQRIYGGRILPWHVVATSLAELVINAYRAAGRKRVDVTTASAPAVRVIHWCLLRLGYPVTVEAIAKVIQRMRKSGTIPHDSPHS